MTGPTRQLPALNIQITADPSKALSAYQKVVSGANKMAKEVQSALTDMSKSMTTALGKSTEKTVKSAKDSLNSLPAYLRGVVSPANKAVLDGMQKTVTKQQDRFRKNLKKHTKDTLNENKREVQRFLNLGAGQGKNATRLTSFGMQVRKGVLASNQSAKASGMDLTDLVANAERRKQQRRAELQRRNKKLDEAARTTREAEDKANKQATQAQAKAIANAHKEARIQSKNFWQRRKNYILAIRQSRAEAAAAAAATHADRRRASRKFWQHKKNYILALRQSKAEQEAAAAAAHAESRRQSKQFWQRRKNYILALRQAQAERDAIAKTAKEEEHAIRRRSRLREISRLKDLRDSRQKAVSQAKDLFSGSGGSMMGARADIFMHRGALQSMAATSTNFLTPFAQVENATIQMRAYAGSAENAKKIVAEMQQFAIQSPYKLEGVLEATSMMMKYGQTAENAMEITKMLGDVAAGDTDKLRLLGLAVGQATGFGRLQGQELRQMVNAGFNPLKTAARELAGGKGVATEEEIEKQMDFLLTAMRKRQLDSDIIKAALQIETSKGGDFVGITAEQAKSLTGWANQFLETLDLIKIQITEAFEPELKSALETVVRYTTAVVGWMKANKELVKQYTVITLKVLGAIVAFHALGMALAATKWAVGSVLLILAPLKAAIQGIIVVVNLLRTGMVTAWIAAIGPIGWLIIAIGGIGLAIAAVRHQNGFWGLAKDAASAFGYLLGFMYNFGHNLAGIFDFIANNWGLMIIDGLLSPLHLIYDPIMWLAELIANVFGTSIPDSVANLTQNLRTEMARIAGIRAEYDTSMFKFDGPKMEDFLNLESYKKALEPFMPPDPNSLIKDKPDIDFKKFIMGAEGEAADPAKLREHAILGSADHAMRMYQYGQDQAAMMGMEAKKNPNAKMEDLLSRIERNTRGSTSPLDNSIEEAALV